MRKAVTTVAMPLILHSLTLHSLTLHSLILGGLILGGVGLGGLGLTACGKKARQEAASLKACKTSRDCTKPNKCIRYAKGKGVCARKCSTHSDCPKPLLCTGEYSWMKYGAKVGRTRFFCRPANRGEGETCTNIKNGCKKGLACEAGKCYRGCADQGDCPKDRTCITVNKHKKVCLTATLDEGAACKAKGMVRCKQGLRCYSGACVRVCSKSTPCPKAAMCRGEAFVGATAAFSRNLGKPNYLFCIMRRDAKKEALANRKCKRHRHCAPPNQCVKFKTVGSVCTHPCKTHDQCPKTQRCTGTYKPNRLKKKRVKLCRASTRKSGESCGGRRGCVTGHRCFQSKCYPECKTGKDCKTDAKCIRIAFGIALPGKRRPTAYLVCLPATGGEGQACAKGKVPYCKRQHQCNRKQCVRTCKKSSDCQGGKACKGSGFGWVGRKFKRVYSFCK
jgi:hypothetical protein